MSNAAASMEREIRAGSRVLGVFENPLNTRVLRAHADGPQRLADLQEKVGWSAQTTVRAAVASLHELGALTRQEANGSSNAMATTGSFVSNSAPAYHHAAVFAYLPDGNRVYSSRHTCLATAKSRFTRE